MQIDCTPCQWVEVISRAALLPVCKRIATLLCISRWDELKFRCCGGSFIYTSVARCCSFISLFSLRGFVFGLLLLWWFFTTLPVDEHLGPNHHNDFWLQRALLLCKRHEKNALHKMLFLQGFLCLLHPLTPEGDSEWCDWGVVSFKSRMVDQIYFPFLFQYYFLCPKISAWDGCCCEGAVTDLSSLSSVSVPPNYYATKQRMLYFKIHNINVFGKSLDPCTWPLWISSLCPPSPCPCHWIRLCFSCPFFSV